MQGDPDPAAGSPRLSYARRPSGGKPRRGALRGRAEGLRVEHTPRMCRNLLSRHGRDDAVLQRHSRAVPPRGGASPISGKIAPSWHPAARCASARREPKRAKPASERIKEYVVSEVIEYKSWVCLICGWIYNEEEGLPEEGIAPGTRFADIPDNWRCPLCDVGKAEFAVVEF
jgi:rubredoxin